MGSVMSKREIIAVNLEYPADDIESINIMSDRTLYDADIILFKPGMPESVYNFEEVQEQFNHWYSQLNEAFQDGKTIFIFLSTPEIKTSIQINRRAGQYEFSTYDTIPFDISRKVGSGKSIKPTADLKFLSTYWREFKKYSEYRVTIEGEFTEKLLETKNGKIVGAMIKGNGTVILLPPLDFSEEKFIIIGKDEDGVYEEQWTNEALSLGKRLTDTK